MKYRIKKYDVVNDIWILQEKVLFFFWNSIGFGSRKELEQKILEITKENSEDQWLDYPDKRGYWWKCSYLLPEPWPIEVTTDELPKYKASKAGICKYKWITPVMTSNKLKKYPTKRSKAGKLTIYKKPIFQTLYHRKTEKTITARSVKCLIDFCVKNNLEASSVELANFWHGSVCLRYEGDQYKKLIEVEKHNHKENMRNWKIWHEENKEELLALDAEKKEKQRLAAEKRKKAAMKRLHDEKERIEKQLKKLSCQI